MKERALAATNTITAANGRSYTNPTDTAKRT
jgi:hypothetical protein